MLYSNIDDLNNSVLRCEGKFTGNCNTSLPPKVIGFDQDFEGNQV